MDDALIVEDENPIWTQTASFYQTKSGVHQPHICEISPFQYQRMGKRARATYDRKRRGEFADSAACKQEFTALVIETFLAKEFEHTDQDVSKDAKRIITHYLIGLREEEVQARRKAARRNNELTIAELTVGARVHHIIYGYGVIKKVNKKSAQFEIENSGKVMKCGEGSFQIHSHYDLEERIC